ncbi:hypothetical protein C2E23DRAFT_462803 [Lenzites betulinus]|nr:hypothetical protein C2E23DRAFT_462803 [Lenzites betulinus]
MRLRTARSLSVAAVCEVMPYLARRCDDGRRGMAASREVSASRPFARSLPEVASESVSNGGRGGTSNDAAARREGGRVQVSGRSVAFRAFGMAAHDCEGDCVRRRLALVCVWVSHRRGVRGLTKGLGEMIVHFERPWPCSTPRAARLPRSEHNNPRSFSHFFGHIDEETRTAGRIFPRTSCDSTAALVSITRTFPPSSSPIRDGCLQKRMCAPRHVSAAPARPLRAAPRNLDSRRTRRVIRAPALREGPFRPPLPHTAPPRRVTHAIQAQIVVRFSTV